MGGNTTPKLTPRQWAVLAELARGMSDRQIAAALDLDIRLVQDTLRSIYRRLSLGDIGSKRVGAVLWYLRQERPPASGQAEPGARPAGDTP